MTEPWLSGGDWLLAAKVIPEQEGGYSVECLHLPGAASQGETVEQALHNLLEAVNGVVDQYLADGQPIPWWEPPLYKEIVTMKAKVRWIAVKRRTA